jgi:hypothetical protein
MAGISDPSSEPAFCALIALNPGSSIENSWREATLVIHADDLQ